MPRQKCGCVYMLCGSTIKAYGPSVFCIMCSNITSMKSYHLLVLFIAILSVSCSNETNSYSTYKPIPGYNGKIKRIVNYNFRNDIYKNRQVAKYGFAIPKEIKEYNKLGLLEKKINIDLVENDGCDYFFITADSICYNGKQERVLEIHHVVSTEAKEFSSFSELMHIVSSKLFADVEIQKQQIINGKYKLVATDTTKYIYEHQNNLLISKTKTSENSSSNIQYKYDKEILSSTIEINHNNDTTITMYSYDNGALAKKDIRGKTNNEINIFDSSERLIYSKDNLFEFYYTYYDTLKITSFNRKKDEYFDEDYNIYLEKTNKDSLLLFEAHISLGSKKNYEDDVIALIERYRDNKILEYDFINEVKKIISKIPNNYTDFKIITYDNYDKYNNPLKKRYFEVDFNWSSYSYDIIKYENMEIYEEIIDYYH